MPFCKNLKLIELNPMYHIKGKKKNQLTEQEKNELFNKLKTQNIGADFVEEDNSSSSVKIEKTVNDELHVTEKA